MKALLAATSLVTVLALAPPAAAAPTGIGPGDFAGVAVEPSGTAHVGWLEGPVTAQTLRYCRLPRSASTCDAGTASNLGPVAGDVANRVAVVVTGARVTLLLTHRPDGGAAALYSWTSPDGGVTFGAKKAVGTVPTTEFAAGPGDTLSVVHANTSGVRYQSVPLDGSAAAGEAVLETSGTTTEVTVGLLDAATPVVVYRFGSGAAMRRYDGSGPVNDKANWTPPVDIGPTFYPKLAGGPSGLMLLGSDRQNPFQETTTIIARRFDGTTFGAPVSLLPGDPASIEAIQDDGGRTHATYQRTPDQNTLELHHVASDDGVTWRDGVAESLPAAQYGSLGRPTLAFAPDHIGLMTASARGSVGFVRLGPDAPAAAPAPQQPRPQQPPPAQPAPFERSMPVVTAVATLTLRGRRWELSVVDQVVARKSDQPLVCPGTVKVELLKGRRVLRTYKVGLTKTCCLKLKRSIPKASISGGSVRVRFSSPQTDRWLAFKTTQKVRVRRR